MWVCTLCNCIMIVKKRYPTFLINHCDILAYTKWTTFWYISERLHIMHALLIIIKKFGAERLPNWSGKSGARRIAVHSRRLKNRSPSCRSGVISIQTIRTSCIRGLLGTVYRYLGQSHVLGEAKKALSPKRTIPPVPSDPITSRPSLVQMSETLFMDSRRLRNERFSRQADRSLMVCVPFLRKTYRI